MDFQDGRAPGSQSHTVSRGYGTLEKFPWRTVVEADDIAKPKGTHLWFTKASCLFISASPRNRTFRVGPRD